MFNKIKKFINIDIIIWFIGSVLITFVGELLFRGKFSSTIEFITNYPYMFITNFTIVLFVTSIAFLFRKRRFVLTLMSFLLILGYFANAMVNSFRGTPVTWADFSSIKDGLSIVTNYLSVSKMIIMAIVLVIAGVAFYFGWKMDKSNDNYKKVFTYAGCTIAISGIMMMGMWKYVNNSYPDHEVNWDIKINCENNGFLYSLISSKPAKLTAPAGYNEELISAVVGDNSATASTSISDVKPNVMLVQMESFLDVSRLEGINYEINPLENYKKLHSENSNGLLGVPTFGGGTVRTEFEMLTGLDIDYLPPGEIPNNSLLKTNTIETLAHILRGNDYEATVMHNYIGNFYDRDIVYANLGFDTFVPYEYMSDVKYNGYYPADDTNLQVVNQILDKEGSQFIYNIGVEGHGPYDTKDRENTYGISGENLTNQDINQLNNYFDAIKGEDKYVADLIKMIEEKNEPTVVVFYSDHLPMLDVVDNEKVFNKDEKRMSDYFIWDNIGLEKKELNLEAYHMSAYVLDLLNMDAGLIPTFHKNSILNDNYKDELELLQYDIIHGDRYLYNGTSYIDKTNMKLGLNDIKLEAIESNNGEVTAKGQYFTEKSKIVIDGKLVDTEFVDSTTLKAKYSKSFKEVSVAQVGRHDKKLGETNKVSLK